MKCFKFYIFILVIFFKSGNVLSTENIFNVNNIELIKKSNISNNQLANEAIRLGYNELISKILLDKDKEKLNQLKFPQIKGLVSYYQMISEEKNEKEDLIKFNIFFDKDKLHNLFQTKGVLYSEISNKEVFILPIIKNDDQIFIYNKNYFYNNWNEIYKKGIIEFVTPIENIEIIQNVNKNKENLLELDLEEIFVEYRNKNLALVLIDLSNSKSEKIYLKTKILGKNIDKNLIIKKINLNKEQYFKKVIEKVSQEITDTVKEQNLIDIRTPSFLNTKLILNKKNNLVELNRRLKEINMIDNIFVQELNSEYIYIKIKYLGKINKIIKQLENQKIILKLVDEQWRLIIT